MSTPTTELEAAIKRCCTETGLTVKLYGPPRQPVPLWKKLLLIPWLLTKWTPQLYEYSSGNWVTHHEQFMRNKAGDFIYPKNSNLRLKEWVKVDLGPGWYNKADKHVDSTLGLFRNLGPEVIPAIIEAIAATYEQAAVIKDGVRTLKLLRAADTEMLQLLEGARTRREA